MQNQENKQSLRISSLNDHKLFRKKNQKRQTNLGKKLKIEKKRKWLKILFIFIALFERKGCYCIHMKIAQKYSKRKKKPSVFGKKGVNYLQ